MNERGWYTTGEAATVLGVSRQMVHQLVCDRKLRSVKIEPAAAAFLRLARRIVWGIPCDSLEEYQRAQEPEGYCSVQEAAGIIGARPARVYQMVYEGNLESCKAGGSRLILRSSAETRAQHPAEAMA